MSRTSAGRIAVFLDRDGVLNRSIVMDGKPYPPRSLEDLDIPADAREACAILRAAGFLLVCVTNQPDLKRGLLDPETGVTICQAVTEVLALDAMLVCPHSDEDDCDCRKPRPGLIRRAAVEHGIDLAASYMVGDRWRDVEAGLAAGCTTLFIDRHYVERKPVGMHATMDAVLPAAEWIVRHARRNINNSTIKESDL